MKVNEIKFLEETASAGVTSVQSIGDVEYAAFPSYIKLYKRDDSSSPKCIAKVKRKTGLGWRFKVTDQWNKMKLPHIGYISNIQTDTKGSKGNTLNLEQMLKRWGVNYNTLNKMSDK